MSQQLLDSLNGHAPCIDQMGASDGLQTHKNRTVSRAHALLVTTNTAVLSCQHATTEMERGWAGRASPGE